MIAAEICRSNREMVEIVILWVIVGALATVLILWNRLR